VDSNLDAEIDQELARMEGLTDLFLGDHGEYEGSILTFGTNSFRPESGYALYQNQKEPL
jgi:hypothetical protein